MQFGLVPVVMNGLVISAGLMHLVCFIVYIDIGASAASLLEIIMMVDLVRLQTVLAAMHKRLRILTKVSTQIAGKH